MVYDIEECLCYRPHRRLPVDIMVKWEKDLAEWLQRLAATVLGSIPASNDTVESEGRQMNQC
jgi:hypothetical protein